MGGKPSVVKQLLTLTLTSCFLVTDLKNGDSSASMPTSLLCGKYPTTELSNAPSLLSLITTLHEPNTLFLTITLLLWTRVYLSVA
jgi:hypothetical protein